jgi:hypothetical protein
MERHKQLRHIQRGHSEISHNPNSASTNPSTPGTYYQTSNTQNTAVPELIWKTIILNLLKQINSTLLDIKSTLKQRA